MHDLTFMDYKKKHNTLFALGKLIIFGTQYFSEIVGLLTADFEDALNSSSQVSVHG